MTNATAEVAIVGVGPTGTKPGVWERICVLDGSLRYRILEPVREEHVLSAELPGIVEPEVPHEVELLGHVPFFVEFLRAPGWRAA